MKIRTRITALAAIGATGAAALGIAAATAGPAGAATQGDCPADCSGSVSASAQVNETATLTLSGTQVTFPASDPGMANIMSSNVITMTVNTNAPGYSVTWTPPASPDDFVNQATGASGYKFPVSGNLRVSTGPTGTPPIGWTNSPQDAGASETLDSSSGMSAPGGDSFDSSYMLTIPANGVPAGTYAAGPFGVTLLTDG